MNQKTETREYIVWGASHLATISSFQILSMNKSIKYIVTSQNNIEIVSDIDSIPELHRYMICVACTPREYLGICEKLFQKGLAEFEDFIFYDLFGKKVALFNYELLSKSVEAVFVIQQIILQRVWYIPSSGNTTTKKWYS